MSFPASWKYVKDNADQQLNGAKELAKDGNVDIGAFYPELYKPWIPSFSNTLGSHLIPDVFTSACVLVDLYDWPDPSHLVRTYGVDLPFLERLREDGHVVLCANLPPERYVETAWLHDILSDKRTIFRSERTPQFFVARRANFIEDCDDLKDRILTHFDHRAASEVEKIAELMSPSHPLKEKETLAKVLSYWGKRLSVLNPDADSVVDQLTSRPEDVILEIRQRQLIDVSPITVGLGGYVRREVKALAKDFPDPINMSLIPKDIQVTIEALNEYFARLAGNVAYSDLTSEKYWNDLTNYKRDEIFDRLSDKAERAAIRAAEETMRRTLLRAGHEGWSERQISEYVNDEVKYWEKLRDNGQNVMFAGGLAALLLGSATQQHYVAVVGGAAAISGSTMVRPLLEKAVPKLQLVNLVTRLRK